MEPQEIVFFGVQTAPSLRTEKVEFPIAVGVGFPDIQKSKTILIRPDEDWEIFSHRDRDKDETVSGYSKKRLFLEGLDKGDAAALIRELIDGRSIYCLRPDKNSGALERLFGTSVLSLKRLSALGLFNQLVSNERFINIEITHKLVAHNYPRNPADVRWMIACYRQCLLGRARI
jgi:hypothetical protein